MAKNMRTERLTLVALTPGLARAALEDRAEQTRLILHEGDRILIGETGFHGPPDRSGTVEVGYSIVPDYRGQGFAFEATRALIDEALARPDVCRITASCLEENVASLKVLEKLGMRRAGSTGETLHFELRRDVA